MGRLFLACLVAMLIAAAFAAVINLTWPYPY
jgi:hypothetical protein